MRTVYSLIAILLVIINSEGQAQERAVVHLEDDSRYMYQTYGDIRVGVLKCEGSYLKDYHEFFISIENAQEKGIDLLPTMFEAKTIKWNKKVKESPLIPLKEFSDMLEERKKIEKRDKEGYNISSEIDVFNLIKHNSAKFEILQPRYCPRSHTLHTELKKHYLKIHTLGAQKKEVIRMCVKRQRGKELNIIANIEGQEYSFKFPLDD
ncbi:hypothetical protein [Aureibacter tunicatorum]|uniref:Uncharacterized protein n=1 Tax=Aureibacter tunicatorum TaxID=866807 RepID=A0AAE4BU98_9BACT|nr:hypothetical protein [Aureibacter tunicatorum]MDR6240820.1 hypothetical protein [Aureibacter tunicatorum]BDD06847.1 hypothetical protein AUTU_43300 [Aureibacter tunicatorum]